MGASRSREQAVAPQEEGLTNEQLGRSHGGAPGARANKNKSAGYARITFKQVCPDSENSENPPQRFTFNEQGGVILKLDNGPLINVTVQEWETSSFQAQEVIRVNFIQEAFYFDGRFGSRAFLRLPSGTAEDHANGANGGRGVKMSDDDVFKFGRTDMRCRLSANSTELKLQLLASEQGWESYFQRLTRKKSGGKAGSEKGKSTKKMSEGNRAIEEVEEEKSDRSDIVSAGTAAENQHRKWTVTPTGATIGRKQENDICLQTDTEVSACHACIDFRENNFYMVDLSSTNGTFQLIRDRRIILPGEKIFMENEVFEITAYEFAVKELQGNRKTMEDRSDAIQNMNIQGLLLKRTLYPRMWFAVYDGHGGDIISDLLKKHLHLEVSKSLSKRAQALNNSSSTAACDSLVIEALHEAFLQADSIFMKLDEQKQEAKMCGSTAITALMLGRRMYVSNVGDSRCVLSRGGTAIHLSNDHKAIRPDEADRIRKLGGVILQNRVLGQLAVTRAFGDFSLKRPMPSRPGSGFAGGPLIIAEPEVMVLDIKSDDEFMILACDGLFDVMSSQGVIDFVRQSRHFPFEIDKSCSDLVHHAVDRLKTRDNVTAAIVQFKYSASGSRSIVGKMMSGLVSPVKTHPSPSYQKLDEQLRAWR